jgi:hypothetical protein
MLPLEDVTAVVRANWKTSVSDVYRQEDVIRHAAEQSDALFQAMPKYLWKVTSRTLCPLDWPTAYKELSIHTGPFVHLPPLLFLINRLRSYRWETLGVCLLVYLRDKTIVCALLETNNMFRYAKFSKEHYQSWRKEDGQDPIPLDCCFVGSFQIWLRRHYPANEGNHLQNGQKEGVVRYCFLKNLPTLVCTSYQNVRAFHNKLNAATLKQSVREMEY